MGILRQRTRKLTIFMWFIIITLPLSTAIAIMPVYASSTVLSAPVIVDETLTPDSTFHINITVADVDEMWGYDFILYYDTTVLTATSYSSYDPFIIPWPSEINDTAGYAVVCYSMMMAEPVGFSTVDPEPIARIDFTVDALGTSILDLSYSEIYDIYAEVILHDVVDGFFANVVLPAHDIAVTDVTASPTTVIAGGVVTIDVTVLNEGAETETFDVTVKYDETEIETQTVTDLASGRSETLRFSWETTGMSKGEYVVKAVASVVEGEVDTADNTYIDGTVSIIVPPVASFTWDPETPYVGETVTFDASASYDPDGTIVEYRWHFGDDTYLVETDPITTHVYTAARTYWVRLEVIDDDGLYDFAGADVTVLPVKKLSIKLSGELDYLLRERVKIRLSALVRDAETMEPVSDANVTIQIYDPDGNLWVSDVMVERLGGTGIYEWESSGTILALRLEKGVYLVHAQASIGESLVGSDILEFHIDPPAEESSGFPIYCYGIVVSVVLVIGVGLVLLKRPIYSRFRRSVQ